MRAAPLMLALPALLCACDLSMTRQPRYGPLDTAPLPGGTEAQAPPEGAVAQGAPALAAAAAQPPPVTPALLERGRERHAIFCQPCHGATGAGDGPIVGRGFPPPLPYGHPKLRAASARELYDAISNGYGVMYPQAERVAPADRWAIVAYIRALQAMPAAPAPAVAR